MSKKSKPLIEVPLKVKKKEKNLLPPREEIAERFIKARGSRKGIDIEALSGVSNTTIGKCENAQQAPNLELLAYYSLKEGIPMDLIVLGTKPPSGGLLELRLQCLALPPDQRLELARELLADLELPDVP